MSSQRAKAFALAERFGGWRDGTFCPAGIPITQIAQAHGTPFYLYHGELIAAQLHRVRAALGPAVNVHYSVKANPSLAVCQLLAREGAGAEVASAGELVLARAAGFPPEATVFAGPGKTDEELRRAAREGIFAVNVESVHEIDRLAAIAAREGRPVDVGLRINPATPLPGTRMRMGGGPSQFGIDEEEIGAAVRRALSDEHLRLRGIHVYTATQVFDVDALLEHWRHVLELGLQVADIAGLPLAMIDFGGGFGVPYFEDSAAFDLDRFGAGFQHLLSRYRSDTRFAGCQFIVELGRYLVAEAGLYVGRVVDVKRSRGQTFAVMDGGMHHHVAATGNWGQVFRKPYPLLNLSTLEREPAGTVSVVGPCCTPLDLFGANLPIGEPKIGDLIGVFDSGAYGYSASGLRFLSHPAPAELLLWQGEAHLIRPAGTVEDVLDGQRGLWRS